jgi:hypothetical protein
MKMVVLLIISSSGFVPHFDKRQQFSRNPFLHAKTFASKGFFKPMTKITKAKIIVGILLTSHIPYFPMFAYCLPQLGL